MRCVSLAVLVVALVALVAEASVPTKSRLRVASVGEDDIAANSISNAKLQPNSVGTANIQAGAVDGSKIARHAVDERHFVPGSITTKSAAIETVTILLRAENVFSDNGAMGGGAGVSPTNRILLKPRGVANTSTVEHHHVRPDGFYKAYGRSSGPGVILGWYPSLNGHLLRYQADRALRTLSCSNVYTEEHRVRKYDVNIGDYDFTTSSFVVDAAGAGQTNFVPRVFMNGVTNGQPILVFADADGLYPSSRGVPSADQGFPMFLFTSDTDSFGIDTFLAGNNDFTIFSSILSRSHTIGVGPAFVGGAADLVQSGGKDTDLRGTRDSQYLVHRYQDLRFEELCGRLGDNVFGPDNIKCLRAQAYHERIYYSNDVRSESSFIFDTDTGTTVLPATGDTEDRLRADLPINLPDSPNVWQRDFGFGTFSDFVLDAAFAATNDLWSRGASGNTPPERCSIYTNIGDVRSETYDATFPDIPGPAEGTPVYSPSLERVTIDETGLIEVRYAGRGLPGASQPDVAITVVVMRNDRVGYEKFGADPNPSVPSFP